MCHLWLVFCKTGMNKEFETKIANLPLTLKDLETLRLCLVVKNQLNEKLKYLNFRKYLIFIHKNLITGS